MCASYVHKSGFKKRKERKEKREREAEGLQVITQFLKNTNECSQVENDDELCAPLPSTSKLETEVDFQDDKKYQGPGLWVFDYIITKVCWGCFCVVGLSG